MRPAAVWRADACGMAAGRACPAPTGALLSGVLSLWTNAIKPLWLICLSVWRRRGAPCWLCRKMPPYRRSRSPCWPLVGYLLLASKTRLPTVFGAAGIVLELILCGSQTGGAWARLAPALRAADLWLFWGAALVLVRLAGRQQSKMPYIAAVPLAVYTVTHFIPSLTSVAAVSFVVFSVVMLWICGHYDPRLQRRAHKKIRRFCANSVPR